MLGIGGGVLLVPLLVLAFGVPMHTAIAASLVAVIATSCAGASSYLKAGLTNLRLGAVLEVTTCVGAVLGGLIAALVSDVVLALLFGLVMLYASYSMFRSGSAQPESVPVVEGVVNRQGGGLGQAIEDCWDRMACTYRDRALQCDVQYRPRRLPLGLSLSLVAGMASGLLGIGGGVVKVPIMHLAMGVPVRAAAGTSNYMVGITAAASAFIYYGNGFVDPSVALPTVLGIFFGARLGARIAQSVQSSLLSRVLAVVLLYVALQMFLRATGLKLA